ncbi:unnamed protein product, partial [Lampetra fluviatilis]
LRVAFQEFAHKGAVSASNLGPCMRTMGFMPTEMEIIEMTQCLQGGGVDFADFVELMKPKLLAESQLLHDLDLNGDGRVSLQGESTSRVDH